MRRAGATLVVAAALAVPVAGFAAGGEPVSITVKAPASARVHHRFAVTIKVVASKGALDIAAKPIKLRARMARECGATIKTTSGPTVLDRKLSPQPSAGKSYRFSATGHPRIGKVGKQAICAFLVDADQHQFATSVDTVVRVRRR